MRSRRRPRRRFSRLPARLTAQAAAVEAMDAEHTAGVPRGYELDRQIREAGAKANYSAVELERMTARHGGEHGSRGGVDEQRIAAGGTTIWRRRASSCARWRASWRQQRSFLENATAEATASREAAQAQQQQAQEAVRAVAAAEQQTERTGAARRCS